MKMAKALPYGQPEVSLHRVHSSVKHEAIAGEGRQKTRHENFPAVAGQPLGSLGEVQQPGSQVRVSPSQVYLTAES